jgi:hypothetical protein
VIRFHAALDVRIFAAGAACDNELRCGADEQPCEGSNSQRPFRNIQNSSSFTQTTALSTNSRFPGGQMLDLLDAAAGRGSTAAQLRIALFACVSAPVAARVRQVIVSCLRYYEAGLEFCSGEELSDSALQHATNFTRAFGLFAVAANQGDAQAQCRVGHMLLMGLGINRWPSVAQPRFAPSTRISLVFVLPETLRERPIGCRCMRIL